MIALISPSSKDEKTNPKMPFDTQISQQNQNHIANQDKGFSPWVRKKTILYQQHSPQQRDYHRFLAGIKLSPRNKGKFRRDLSNEEEGDNLEALKADLSSKLRAQKIGDCQISQDKTKNRFSQPKNFFQRRTNITKLYRRPKSIDLGLQFDPQNIMKCFPLRNGPLLSLDLSHPLESHHKDHRPIHKLRKKVQKTDQERTFSTTMNQFRINILAAQKKMYQTLEINFPSQQKQRKPANIIDQMNRTAAVLNRSKIPKQKQQRPSTNFEGSLTCQGRNATINLGHKTCRQKLKNGNNIDNGQIFV